MEGIIDSDIEPAWVKIDLVALRNVRQNFYELMQTASHNHRLTYKNVINLLDRMQETAKPISNSEQKPKTERRP